MGIYFKDTFKLSFRILDELLNRESKMSHTNDFSQILLKEIFIKSIFVCAIETVFFINNVRHM